MNLTNSSLKGYVVATCIGVVGGGLMAMLITRALPKIMMNMMSYAGDGLCSPEEIGRQMMGFGESQSTNH